MTASGGGTIQTTVSGIALVGFYAAVLWRIVKRNSGNRVIESGSMALVLFFIMAAAINIPSLPDWVVPGLGILFLLLGFLMIFFLMQQGYNAIRRNRRD
ncbi:MAG: hypothetical protein ABSD76_04185 [Terriglobales bacterium]|jgi:hypothetical protein